MREMNDRELLELAAKAYVDESWHGNESYMRGFMSTWIPLEDDGQALRLAAVLSMRLDFCKSRGCAARFGNDCENVIYVCIGEDNDLFKAIRRAIVRAAAEIGRQM